MKSKYQFLINGREIVGIKKIKNSKELIGYSQTIDDVYKNLEHFNPTKKGKKLIVLMIWKQMWNLMKIISSIVTE